MVILKVLLFFLLFCVAKADEDFKTKCRDEYTDMKHRPIKDVKEYCRNKLCVLKCCSEGELFGLKRVCVSEKMLRQRLPHLDKIITEHYNYGNIQLYSWDGHGVKESTRNSADIEFILNKRNPSNCTAEMSGSKDFFILEDGSIRSQDKDISKAWGSLGKLEYCVEFNLVHNKTHPLHLIMREPYVYPDDAGSKTMYALVGFLISIFFLVLVLVVYSLLPELRNLIGLIMMAYVSSLILLFTLKCIIILTNISLTNKFCKTISPMLYFVTLSSFFWLNIMAVDVCMSLRRTRTSTSRNNRVKYRKFMMYGLYAWGTPLLITAIVTLLDNIDISNLNIEKPPFVDCMAGFTIKYYLDIPIGILISINIILFLLTVFHIWMVKRAVSHHPNSTNSSRQNNKFYLCMKLSLIMGVSWVLELFDTKDIYMFVILNTFNIFTGAAIFFLFVFKKNIFAKLCRKLNIDNEYVRNYESSQYPRSGTTKSTRLSTFRNRSESKEMKIKSIAEGPKEERAAA